MGSINKSNFKHSRWHILKMSSILLFFGILLFTPNVYSANPADISWEDSLSGAIAKAQRENKKILLFVYQEHNPWCENYDERIFANADVRSFADRYICARINLDNSVTEARNLMVKGVPSILLLDKSGNEIDRIWSRTDVQRLISDLQSFETNTSSFNALKTAYNSGRATIAQKVALADEYRKRGDFTYTSRLYEEVLTDRKDDPAKAEAYLFFAKKSASKKDYPLAEQYLQKILNDYQSFNKTPEVLLELGGIYFAQKDKAKAKELYQRFLNDYPTRPEISWVERRLERCD